jgi:hypothetical protein
MRDEHRASQKQQVAGETEMFSEEPAPKAILSTTTVLVLNRDLRDEKLVAADITDRESEGTSSYLTTGSGFMSGSSRRPISTWKKVLGECVLPAGYPM